MSLLLDDEPRQRPRRNARSTYRRRRVTAAIALLLLLTFAGVLLLRPGGGVQQAPPPPAHAASEPEPPAPALITQMDRWRGYAERRAPRRERFTLRFGKDAPRGGMVFDLRSGRVLWARSPRTGRPIASLTKMMTALLVADAVPRGAKVEITPESLDYEGSGVGLFKRGQRIDVDTMLYGLMLPSGNDAAIALAQRVAGTQPRFVDMMNRRARALELTCTRFSSPSGILDAGNRSCPRDLARLAKEVLERPRLARIVATENTVRGLPPTRKGKRRKLWLSNNNTLMRRDYDGVTGVKTGYTNAAGSCLVATVRRAGRHLGVVLLKSPDTGEQGSRLLDAAFRRLNR